MKSALEVRLTEEGAKWKLNRYACSIQSSEIKSGDSGRLVTEPGNIASSIPAVHTSGMDFILKTGVQGALNNFIDQNFSTYNDMSRSSWISNDATTGDLQCVPTYHTTQGLTNRFNRAAGQTNVNVQQFNPNQAVKTSSNQRQTSQNLTRGEVSQQDDLQWQEFSSTNGDIFLSVASGFQLVVTVGNTIQENLSLWNCKKWLRAVRKGDSMLFVVKIQGACRKFRVMFSGTEEHSAADVCGECCKKLSSLLNIKDTSETGNITTHRTLNPIQNVRRNVIGCDVEMTSAYQRAARMREDELEEMIRVCLSDTQFARFVGRVERILEHVVAAPEL